jgi:hypothetical protein
MFEKLKRENFEFKLKSNTVSFLNLNLLGISIS